MRIGIDLGGTKIEGVVLDIDATESCRKRILTPQGDYQATLTAVADLVVALVPTDMLPSITNQAPANKTIPTCISAKKSEVPQ